MMLSSINTGNTGGNFNTTVLDMHCLVTILIIHLGLEREFKEISQNLRKFGSSKRNFNLHGVEALVERVNRSRIYF